VKARVRLAALAAVAALATVGLSACQLKAGEAAYVNKTSISESEVGSYVNVDAPAPDSGSIGAKSFVVQELVKKTVLNDLAQEIGKVPSDSDLSTLHDTALSQVFQTTVSGAAADSQLRSAAASKGLKPSFDSLYIRNVELSTAIGDYLQSASTTAQANLQKKLGEMKVRLNPRYGTWSLNNLAVDGTTMPSWLKSAS
jgi:hypothetical protein